MLQPYVDVKKSIKVKMMMHFGLSPFPLRILRLLVPHGGESLLLPTGERQDIMWFPECVLYAWVVLDYLCHGISSSLLLGTLVIE